MVGEYVNGVLSDLYSERKKLSKFFMSLVFVYKSISLKRFHTEQLCPSIDSTISLVFVHHRSHSTQFESCLMVSTKTGKKS